MELKLQINHTDGRENRENKTQEKGTEEEMKNNEKQKMIYLD